MSLRKKEEAMLKKISNEKYKSCQVIILLNTVVQYHKNDIGYPKTAKGNMQLLLYIS